MCLTTDIKATERYRKKLTVTGKRWAWKYLRVGYKAASAFEATEENIYLFAPYHTATQYKPGEILSNRNTIDLSPQEMHQVGVYRGIHVKTSRQAAVRDASRNDVVLRVEVEASDFVAAGNQNDAVFMKVRVHEKDYKRAIRQWLKQIKALKLG